MLKGSISSDQIRAARALLRWSAQKLAAESGVGIATIKRYEVMEGVPAGNSRVINALRAALESGGVEFIGSPEDGPGVRMRPPKP